MVWSLLKREAKDTQSAGVIAQEGVDAFIVNAPVAVMVLDGQGKIVLENHACKALLRSQVSPVMPDIALKNNFLYKLTDAQRGEFESRLRAVVAEECPVVTLHCHVDVPAIESAGAETLHLALTLSPYARLGEDGKTVLPAAVMYIRDITEQSNLEMRFVHSQKMQAVGQLAGGIAHDFNNLLTAMIGFCDLLLMRHPAGDPSFADIMQVKQNANRAANLVRQLLAFSRKQTLQLKSLDLTEVLAELSNLIRRLIGENIELHMTHGRDIGLIKADQGQLEQVLINLAVNARDAMKAGGSLTMRTSNARINSVGGMTGGSLAGYVSPSQEDPIQVGEYVLIEVEDSGEGIHPDKMQKIFEPFFSTKEVGQGTGLGLSTVYGIIKQTGGYIYVKSVVGVGTTFRIYFPLHHAEEVATESTAHVDEAANAADLTGVATILLVEDETPVRIFAARALRNKGYEVLEADCGENAIEVFSEYEGDIDVIISDVIMPGMNGPTMITTLEKDFAERMKKLQVIFISGYAEDAFVDTFGAEREFNFLPKPFTLKQLASKIKDVVQKAA